jgi:hypothetical protein
MLRNVLCYLKYNFFNTKMLTCNIIIMYIIYNFMTYTRVYCTTVVHYTNMD